MSTLSATLVKATAPDALVAGLRSCPLPKVRRRGAPDTLPVTGETGNSHTFVSSPATPNITAPGVVHPPGIGTPTIPADPRTSSAPVSTASPPSREIVNQ